MYKARLQLASLTRHFGLGCRDGILSFFAQYWQKTSLSKRVVALVEAFTHIIFTKNLELVVQNSPINHNQINQHANESLQSPPQCGHQNDSHKRGETRASAQSGCLGARVRSPTQWGVSLFAKSIRKQRGHHLVV